jgi:hypothetical protein
MQWSDIASTVGKFAPLVGTALGGPAGAAVGAIVSAALGTPNSPDAVSQALQVNPDAAVKLAEIEKDKTLGIQQLVVAAEANRLAADTAAIQAVNTTMQAEDKSDHWPTYTWRPFCGFVFGAMFLGTYFVLPLLKLPVPAVPFEAWTAMGAILGVASWFRGKMQASGTADVRG